MHLNTPFSIMGILLLHTSMTLSTVGQPGFFFSKSRPQGRKNGIVRYTSHRFCELGLVERSFTIPTYRVQNPQQVAVFCFFFTMVWIAVLPTKQWQTNEFNNCLINHKYSTKQGVTAMSLRRHTFSNHTQGRQFQTYSENFITPQWRWHNTTNITSNISFDTDIPQC